MFDKAPDVINDIEVSLTANNNDPMGFVWTDNSEEILEKVRRVHRPSTQSPFKNGTLH